MNLRILYFFHGRRAVVVSHGFSKQGARVPDREMEVALRSKRSFEGSPAKHTYRGEGL